MQFRFLFADSQFYRLRCHSELLPEMKTGLVREIRPVGARVQAQAKNADRLDRYAHKFEDLIERVANQRRRLRGGV